MVENERRSSFGVIKNVMICDVGRMFEETIP